jgi:hypothetical protein
MQCSGCSAPVRREPICHGGTALPRPVTAAANSGNGRDASTASYNRSAEDLREGGKLDLSRPFVDATLASAKTEALRLVDHRREKFEYQFHSHVRPASAENARL